MQRILSLLILVFSLVGFFFHTEGQTFDPFIQNHVDELTYDSVYSRLQSFEDLGIKEVGSDALDETRDWIINLYQQWGYTDIEIDSFNYGQPMVHNIIVTKTGTLYPDTYLIVDGHYDTYNGPGVNDNGSGTTVVLEIARMMKNLETAYSIKFIHFTMEEMGLVGSTHYVENTVIPQNLDIRLVFNIDEVGGVAGEVNNTITCERDEWPPNGNNAASAAFTDTLANLTELYTTLNTSISYAYGSDYVPFMNNGYIVTGFYEYNESPYPHSINDSLANLDPEYVYEVTRASLAASMYFSGASEINIGITDFNENSYEFHITPNPFVSFFEVNNRHPFSCSMEILNIHGEALKKFSLKPESVTRIIPNMTQGIYLYRILYHDEMLVSGKLLKK